ncbi:metallophosphoesterase family protein [Clostridium estertheticum]|uniref:metallophosphoesterase family protein n=1 Tax=Clostridium estertheticum TaxID=238834 RepID=UPI001C0E4AA6|nr:metallophosphoesterase [Clostridium estertheticum]MBU3075838.1 hypothetical protein [Clostridium estertheticum]MBU3166045.1 hypothetical protein [Clostridium estertheticum]MBU3187259.1 hypothetical protein [Clostridium estertheticum]
MKIRKKLSKSLVAIIAAVGLISGTSTSAFASTSKMLYEFDVISDTHVGATDPNANAHTTTALNCIKNNFNDKSIVINGDVVDNYWDSSYNALYNIVSNANSGSKKLPYIYFNFGNHEFRPSASSSSQPEWYDWSLSQFDTYTRKIQTNLLSPNGVSYGDRGQGQSYDLQHINNTNLFFLGTDRLVYGDTNDCADLDRDTQLNYLKGTLDSGRLTFMFCHQPPHGTVHASDWKNCIWDSVNSDNNSVFFKSLIGQYKNAIMFTSHTHNDFNTYPLKGNDDNFAMVGNCPIFGTSSIKDASQGCHVVVYNNQVVVTAMHYISDYKYEQLGDPKVISY